MIVLNKIQKVPIGEPSCHLYMDWENNILTAKEEASCRPIFSKF